MNLQRKLDRELRGHAGNMPKDDGSDMRRYVAIAEAYAENEHQLAVLSDLAGHESVVVHGKFSQLLDIDTERCGGRIASIWEEDIFRIVHSDDIAKKMLNELLFFHHIGKLPPARRFDRCLMQRLRMRGRGGEWLEVLHRLYYLPARDGKSVGFALCLYGAMTLPLAGGSMAVDTVTGRTVVLGESSGGGILSRREKEVLRMIAGGDTSREIACALNISICTVSRHRQNIIAKLQVRNSVEACRRARSLDLL